MQLIRSEPRETIFGDPHPERILRAVCWTQYVVAAIAVVLCVVAFQVSNSQGHVVERLREMSRLNAQLTYDVQRMTSLAQVVGDPRRSHRDRNQAAERARTASDNAQQIGTRLVDTLSSSDLNSFEAASMQGAQLAFMRFVTQLDLVLAAHKQQRPTEPDVQELLEAKLEFEAKASAAYGLATHVADKVRKRNEAFRAAVPIVIAICVLFQAICIFRPLVRKFSAALKQDQEAIRLAARNEALETRADELARALEQSQTLARVKSEIIANVSHELRTPLNGVLGMTSALMRSDLEPEARRMVETISASGDTLLRVIGDVLDFSKIEAGRMEIELAPVAIDEVTRDVVELYRAHAAEKGIEILATMPPEPAPRVEADSVRLRQVLSNLVANAIKFTSRGHVSVGHDWCKVDDRLVVRLWVEDTGIGIPAHRLEAIFDSFIQVDGSTQRRFGGTGLGLTISRRLVELMGGTIAVESELDRGSRFMIEIPFTPVPGSSGDAPGGSRQVEVPRGLRVLLAEDNKVNVMVARALLRQYGCEIDVAENGLRAIGLASENQYDLAFMDVQMPICDGLEATRAIRQAEALEGRPRLPIYALTANAMREDRTECLDAGMDGFIAKPIRTEELEVALAQSARTSPDLAQIA